MTHLEVIATAARTPVGLCAESTAAAVRCGVTRAREFPFVSEAGELVVVHYDCRLSTKWEGRERVLLLAEAAWEEALAKLERYDAQPGQLHLLLSLPEPRPGFSNEDAAWVFAKVEEKLRARVARTRLPPCHVVLAGRGHAGPMLAMQQAVRQSASEAGGLYLVLGADSYHHPDTFVALEKDRRFAGPEVRSGFVPGEGAGCLVLATATTRKAWGAPSLAQVAGVGSAQESLLRQSDTGSFGEAMSLAVAEAVAELSLPKQAVDAVYCDINGERYRSEEWGFVALRVSQAFKPVDYQAPADCWGDVGASFGPLAANLAVQSFTRGYFSGSRALILAGSDSGLRGALLVQRAESEGL